MRVVAKSALWLGAIAMVMALGGCGDPEPSTKAKAPAENVEPPLPDAKAKTVQETPARFQESLYSDLTCNIETLNGKTFPPSTTVNARKVVHMSGWFFDVQSKTVPPDTKVRFQAADGQSAWEQKLAPTVDRSDVVKAFGGSEGILKSGFGADVDFTGVKLGEYLMYLSAQTPRGERLCGKWRVTLE